MVDAVCGVVDHDERAAGDGRIAGDGAERLQSLSGWRELAHGVQSNSVEVDESLR